MADPIIFFDMDGVLAKWDTESAVEDTFLPGYFLNREPDQVMINSLRTLLSQGYDVRILSAVYPGLIYRAEKEEWLKKYVGNVQAIFLPCGDSKAHYVTLSAGQKAILIDDYTRNLVMWECEGAEYIGIKYLNGVNNTRGTWSGFRIAYQMDVPHVVKTIEAIANL